MSRSRRTLLFVLIFLSAKNVFVSSQISPGMVSVSTDLYKGTTLQPTNLKPDLISAAKSLLSSSLRPSLTEAVSQPVISEPLDITNRNSFQQVPSNYPAQNVPYNSAPAILSSPEILPMTSPLYSVSPQIPEYPIDSICSPLASITDNQMPQALSLPEALYVDNFVSYPGLSQLYEPPVSVPVPSAPTITNFVPVIRPAEAYGDLSPAVYPGTVNTQQITAFPSLIESVPVYQPPLQTPQAEQPVIVISLPTPDSSVLQDASYKSSFSPMVPPSPPIIIEGSKSRWRSWLPILLIALCDGGCRNNNGGNSCCSGRCNIPIPYPIPIPTNNPIILGRGGKGKASSSSDDD